MNTETALVLVALFFLTFLGWMGYLVKSKDSAELKIKVEAGLIQKIEGGTVIWTKP